MYVLHTHIYMYTCITLLYMYTCVQLLLALHRCASIRAHAIIQTLSALRLTLTVKSKKKKEKKKGTMQEILIC